ncbi:MAG: FG-GAP repeat protein [Candidatus Aminicenantales bacterium]
MHKPIALTILAAGLASLLMVGCQTKDEEPIPEGSFKSLLKLTASDAADSDSYGLTVAIQGDLALVGAPGASGGGTQRGEAYLYQRSQGGTDGWGQIKILVADDAADGDFFGVSVSLSGDYAVVGAVGENGSGSDQGAAYVFFRNHGGTDNWGQVRKIAASDKADSDGFGFSVSIDGATIAVGSDGEDGAGTDRGAAYIFVKDQGGVDNWGQVAKIVSADPADSDRFGYSVAVAGDFALVGAPMENGDGTDRGAAYVFARDLGGLEAWGLLKRLEPGTPSDSALFGNSVAVEGSLAVVGAGWEDGGGTDRGAAYLFSRDEGGADLWGQIKRFAGSDASDGDYFGYSVSLNGANVVIGASYAEGGGTERGQAYVFSKDEGGVDTWGEVQRLRASDGANGDRFGGSAAISGSYILVGATGEDGAGTDRGAAYLFKKS